MCNYTYLAYCSFGPRTAPDIVENITFSSNVIYICKSRNGNTDTSIQWIDTALINMIVLKCIFQPQSRITKNEQFRNYSLHISLYCTFSIGTLFSTLNFQFWSRILHTLSSLNSIVKYSYGGVGVHVGISDPWNIGQVAIRLDNIWLVVFCTRQNIGLGRQIK